MINIKNFSYIYISIPVKKNFDCFLMKTGSTALDFAYTLHTTMGDNFIRAINVKTKQIIGRDYILQSGDVIELIFNKP